MSPDVIPRQVVQTALRADLPFIGIATVALIAGLASLLLGTLGSRDRLLLWLGVFSSLYGIRLFTHNGLVHAAIGGSDYHFLLWTLCLTYVIPIPYASFARELFGAGWKRSFTAWIWLEIAFALIFVPVTLYLGPTDLADHVNTILVTGGTLLMMLHLILGRAHLDRVTKGLRWPLAVAGILVLFTNQGFRPAGIELEPLGFLILLGGLGWTAAAHAVARERQLVEVEGELALARRIQTSIIPDSPPEFSALRFGMRYQPMTSVAGDFFDFLKTGERSLSVLVADVSGHGVPAALVASMLKVCFAAQQSEAHDPAKVLTGLNTMLRGSLGGQYVTASCAAIDLAAGQVTYAGAGHPPALLLRSKQGDVLQLAQNGLFIGPFPHATYSNMAVPFEDGDKLLLYTDGILEACGPDGQEFGGKNLEALLLDTEHLEPAEFVKIATPAQQDDLTVVLMSFQPTNGSVHSEVS